jgi:hypothetical protein
MKGYLLDINFLLALAWPTHVHHRAAQAWFDSNRLTWATCTVTQLGFVRLSSNPAFTRHEPKAPAEARDMLRRIAALPDHQFWPEPPRGLTDAFLDPIFAQVRTHASVTDGYLVAAAHWNGGKLVTFDGPLKAAFADLVERPSF